MLDHLRRRTAVTVGEANRAYFDRDARDFDSAFRSPKTMHDPVRRLVQRAWKGSGPRERYLDALKLVPQEIHKLEILEVGCGHGHCSLAMAELGARVSGIDYSTSMLTIANKNRGAVDAAIAQRCRFVHADVFTYSPDHQVDLVVALGVVDYIAANHTREFLTRLFAFSRTWVLVAFPMKYHFFYPVRKLWLRIEKRAYVVHFSRGDVLDLDDGLDGRLMKLEKSPGYWLCLFDVSGGRRPICSPSEKPSVTSADQGGSRT